MGRASSSSEAKRWNESAGDDAASSDMAQGFFLFECRRAEPSVPRRSCVRVVVDRGRRSRIMEGSAVLCIDVGRARPRARAAGRECWGTCRCWEQSAFAPLVPSMKAKLPDILCLKTERTVGNDNCVSYKGRTLQIPPQRHRCHYVRAKGDGSRVRARRHGRPPRDPEAGALRCEGEAAGPGRSSGMSRSARPPRLAPLASSDGGTPKRTFHVLGKPAIPFAPNSWGTCRLQPGAIFTTLRAIAV